MEDKMAKAQKTAAKMKAAKREKYKKIIDAGAPAEIARRAVSWGPDRIKKELGIEFPKEG